MFLLYIVFLEMMANSLYGQSTKTNVSSNSKNQTNQTNYLIQNKKNEKTINKGQKKFPDIALLEGQYLFISTNKEYELHKQTFEFGTYQKQLDTLKLIRKKVDKIRKKLIPTDATHQTNTANMSEEAYSRLYSKLVENYFDDPPNQDFQIFLVDWIGFFHLQEYSEYLIKQLEGKTRRKKGFEVILKARALASLAKLVDSPNANNSGVDGKLFYQFYYDSAKNGGHDEIKLSALKGLKKKLDPSYHKKLKTAFGREKSSHLKRGLIEVITAYQDQEDLDFLKSQVETEKSFFIKKGYLSLFTNYSQSELAKEIVLEFYRNKDDRITKEALKVLGHFRMDYDFYIDVGKKNQVEIRLEAVKQLGKDEYESIDKVNSFLKFLATNDDEPRIKKQAIKALEKRNLYKDGKPVE